ncbi:MAG: branched-chain amino acid ABC transporter permease [Anaerolineae bacterium]|nr:branched-chain amino acid ABC transporter permease [Candidatus Roseilinea sp.]MDW8451447.1 branched-chain amino acid ABC transporter permease [Anaerolineae bacterium]
MKRFAPLLLIVAVLGLAGLAQSALNDYYQRVLAVIAINIILAVSLNLTNGYSGDFSLGHAAFMAIGAYTSAILTLPARTKAIVLPDLPLWLSQVELPFIVAILIGAGLAALVAFVVGIPVLRLRGHYLAVATLGLMVIVQVVALNWQPVTRGARGISGLPPFTTLLWAYGWMLVTVAVIWRIVHSPLGRAMMAVREDELAAACRGVPVFRTRLLAFVCGALFASVAGALWAHLITAITPSSFSFLITFNVVAMVVIGGAGSISGSVIGAVLMTLLPELLRRVETTLAIGGQPLYGLSQIVIALMMLAVMLFRPQGLMGRRELPDVLAGLAGARRASLPAHAEAAGEA